MLGASLIEEKQGGKIVRLEKKDYPLISTVLAHFLIILELTVNEWYDGNDHWLVLVDYSFTGDA